MLLDREDRAAWRARYSACLRCFSACRASYSRCAELSGLHTPAACGHAQPAGLPLTLFEIFSGHSIGYVGLVSFPKPVLIFAHEYVGAPALVFSYGCRSTSMVDIFLASGDFISNGEDVRIKMSTISDPSVDNFTIVRCAM